MPDATPTPAHDHAPAPTGQALNRRMVLTGAAVAGGALLVTGPANVPAQGEAPHGLPAQALGATPYTVDIAASGQVADIRLTMPSSPIFNERGTTQNIVLTSEDSKPVEVTISSTTGRTRVTILGSSSYGTEQRAIVSKGKPATVVIAPIRVGPPLETGDTLKVTSGPSRNITIPVWIEPTGGSWTSFVGKDRQPLDLGIVAIHAAVLRKGDRAEVLMFSPPRKRVKEGDQNSPPLPNPAYPNSDRWIWDPEVMHDVEVKALDLHDLTVSGRPMPASAGGPENIFCSGHAQLPDGRLLVVGGHLRKGGHHTEGEHGRKVFLYDPNSKSHWIQVQSALLDRARWYPTVTCLPDGRMLVTSGSYDGLWDPKKYFAEISNTYMVFEAGGGDGRFVVGPGYGVMALIDEKELKKKDKHQLSTYPAVFVLPGRNDGKAVVAMVESNRAWLYDYTLRSNDAPLSRASGYREMRTEGSRTYPHYGSTVLLPLTADSGSARILAVGGQSDKNDDHRDLSRAQKTTRTAEILDLDTSRELPAQRGWRSPESKQNQLTYQRFLCDSTLLADGTVLVSGGSTYGWTDDNQGPVYYAELFDPATETFRPAARATTDRRYHSVALLLPDGTVLKAGSSGGFGADIAQTNERIRSHTDAERYLPPYLWRGPRPTIDALVPKSSVLDYGSSFTITARGPNLGKGSRVGLIRLGSVTHGNNMSQRFVWLPVTNQTRHADQWSIRTSSPKNAGTAPPGDYFLVVLDKLGVPSEGRLVSMRTPTA